MATNNAVNNSLTGQTGTGNFVGSTSPSLTNPDINAIYSTNLTLTFGNATSAVNYLQITNAATGNPVSLSAQGTDTNIPLYLAGKGATQVRLGNDLLMYNTAGGNNYTVFTITASGAQTVTVPSLSGTMVLSSNIGTAGQVLTSNGAGVAPSYQNAAGGTDAAFGFLLMGG